MNIEKQLSLEKYPPGSKINYEGIVLERNTTGTWDCSYFNKETGKCKVYSIRPILCRSWHCKQSKFPEGFHDDNKIVIIKHGGYTEKK